MTSTTNNPVLKAIYDMRELMELYEEFGACDTEPRGVLQGILVDFYKYGDAFIPDDAPGWQLFLSKPDVDEVAGLLASEVKHVLRVASENRDEFREALEYIYGEWVL